MANWDSGDKFFYAKKSKITDNTYYQVAPS